MKEDIHQDMKFEESFWGDCTNTFSEEKKQFTYARFMGLQMVPHEYTYYYTGGKKILDVGGGPVSLMLKALDLKKGSMVIDPIQYPDWCIGRYAMKGIRYVADYGENIQKHVQRGEFDEVWMYNCLQHVTDPSIIIDACKYAGPVLRIFEWINIPPHEGHPQMLTADKLDGWIGQNGHTINVYENKCVGRAYYGTFTHA
jgi:hypothetical protein